MSIHVIPELLTSEKSKPSSAALSAASVVAVASVTSMTKQEFSREDMS